jgi:hypothetical protein
MDGRGWFGQTQWEGELLKVKAVGALGGCRSVVISTGKLFKGEDLGHLVESRGITEKFGWEAWLKGKGAICEDGCVFIFSKKRW